MTLGGHERLARRLDVHAPTLTILAARLFEDLDPTRLGIGWWAPAVPFPTRALIGDYLHAAAEGVVVNLIEAAIHMRNVERRMKADNAQLRARPTQAEVIMPPPAGPGDELPAAEAALEIAGFFRAIASAADCLAAVAAGVVPIPTSVRHAGWPGVRSQLTEIHSGDRLPVATALAASGVVLRPRRLARLVDRGPQHARPPSTPDRTRSTRGRWLRASHPPVATTSMVHGPALRVAPSGAELRRVAPHEQPGGDGAHGAVRDNHPGHPAERDHVRRGRRRRAPRSMGPAALRRWDRSAAREAVASAPKPRPRFRRLRTRKPADQRRRSHDSPSVRAPGPSCCALRRRPLLLGRRRDLTAQATASSAGDRNVTVRQSLGVPAGRVPPPTPVSGLQPRKLGSVMTRTDPPRRRNRIAPGPVPRPWRAVLTASQVS